MRDLISRLRFAYWNWRLSLRGAPLISGGAKNRVYEEADAIPLPVPVNTKSGDPVVIGQLPAVAVTDRDAWTPGYASCDCDGAYKFNVHGLNSGGNAAIAIGDIVYLQNDGTISANTGGKRFGYALGAVNSGATTLIVVKIGY